MYKYTIMNMLYLLNKNNLVSTLRMYVEVMIVTMHLMTCSRIQEHKSE